MVKRILPAAAAIALVIGACVWLFGSSREDEVIRQFSALSDLIEKTPDENNMRSLLKADKVGDLFDRECTLTMTGNPMSGTYSPNEMGALALKMRSGFTRVAIRFSDHEVTFPDDNTAEVLMVTRVKGETLAAGKVDELLETRSRLNEVEGEWRFAEFTVIESLQK
jgi:hypothetical protein